MGGKWSILDRKMVCGTPENEKHAREKWSGLKTVIWGK